MIPHNQNGYRHEGHLSRQYCVTLTVGPALCLLQTVVGAGGLRSTPCNRESLAGGGVEKVEFTVLGLEPGDHTLTFTLETQHGKKDILEKKLRVVVCTGGLM